MRRHDLLRLVLPILLVVSVVYLRDDYVRLSERLGLSPAFFNQLYYLIFASVLLMLGRQLILLIYRWRKPERREDNVVMGVKLISQIIYGSFIIVLVLTALRIDVREAFTSLSLIAAAIALITKDYISNMINGMILAFSDSIQIDDHVSIGEYKGRVKEITLTNIRILTDDDDAVFIPNNKVLSVEIINYTRQEIRKSSVDFEWTPDKIGKVDELEKRIIHEMKEHESEIQKDTFNLKIVQIRKDSILLKFQYVLINPKNKELEKAIRRHCVRRIVEIYQSL